ncbi:flagellar hook protein FlgE [Hydrogenispora ethanolica]|uniref:Flagellar hook protein FlgE n=1 Tax=Hydrogenispora ethanolica TaxID=1082276 RepID=A0A4R1QV93_HYDET|nr:flagellar hook protein FlgE [Hydrogenispora ethanolica]TCL57886.1 flagellar hook protein FlgE [Hydrogenispora ethanolica]
MMTSMYSGVSGLKAQQQKLNVIGNNIANVNTAGYKAQTVSFSDLLSQTLSSATGANATTNTGGTNPIQVGLGVSVAAVTTNMSVGSTQSTGNYTDVAIGGDGFFIVQGGSVGEYQFTRAGNFGVDEEGNLVVNGYKVCGWEEYSVDSDGNYVFNTQQDVEPLNLFSDSTNGNKQIIAPQATTAASITGSLDPAEDANGTALNTITIPLPDTASASTTMTVYDALGNSYEVKANLYKCYTDETTNTTSYYWTVDSTDTSALAVSGASGYIEFDSSGKIVTTDTTNYDTNPTITLTPQGSNAGAAAFEVSLDFSKISYYSSSTGSGISVASVDGYESGDLQDITIGSDGVIYGVYSNDQTQPLGMIALAVFSNSSGLEKIGDNLYTTTANSGDFTGGVAAGTSGSGTLSTGTLEMSNVDLSEQFSEMMITQRAYQANSKVITTTDNILEVLVNLIR